MHSRTKPKAFLERRQPEVEALAGVKETGARSGNPERSLRGISQHTSQQKEIYTHNKRPRSFMKVAFIFAAAVTLLRAMVNTIFVREIIET
jgi:hypothetical protein